ncbi:MAG: hypothetical protein RQ826_09545 [Xanthomonadales bacterium]|nr:hypothetical protein [Xanthomonadales bacterium]
MNDYLFQVPERFIAALQSGQMTRFGGILKDNATGRIVGHLQETGLSNSLMNSVMGGPLAPVTTISSLGANYQLAAVTKMLGMMQVLQFATLGASIAGLGVSAVGFSILNRKINRIGDSVEAIHERVKKDFRWIKLSRMRDSINDLRGLTDTAEHLQGLDRVKHDWVKLGSRFRERSGRIRSELEYIIDQPSFDDELFKSYLGALCVSNTLASKCFIFGNDYERAHSHAELISEKYDDLFSRLSPRTLLEKMGIETKYMTQDHKNQATEKIQFIRDLQATASTFPALIARLDDAGICGSEYLRRLREDDTNSIVVIDAS